MSGVARPSVASVLVEPRVNNMALGSATGFVVQRGAAAFLVTNRHVVRGRHNDTDQPLHPSGGLPDSLVLVHHVSSGGGQIGGINQLTQRLYDDSGEALWLEHPAYRTLVDVVALPLPGSDPSHFFTYDPWTDPPPGWRLAAGISRPLFIVGFPFGITGGGVLGVWVQGVVATELDVDWNGRPAFLIDSRTRPGQSGSPVLAYHFGGPAAMEGGSTVSSNVPYERLMGIYSGRLRDDSDLGIVWKKSLLTDIVDSGVRGTA